MRRNNSLSGVWVLATALLVSGCGIGYIVGPAADQNNQRDRTAAAPPTVVINSTALTVRQFGPVDIPFEVLCPGGAALEDLQREWR